MLRRSLFASLFFVGSLSFGAGCSGSEAGDTPENKDDDFASDQATLLDFEFDGALTTDFSWNDETTIQSQLLYTVGHLNWDNSVGRLDALELTNIQKKSLGGDKIEISYHAKLPVAWGSKTNLPKTYELKLPKDVSHEGLEAFVDAHKDRCVDRGAHDLDAGSMWYYYRPQSGGCTFQSGELSTPTAKVTVSKLNTKDKYPEYHEVWKDDRLEVVAIFGKYEATGGAWDAGVQAFNGFAQKMKETLGPNKLKTTPANVGDRPAPETKDITFEATLPDGKQVKVTALMVDAITSVWDGFDERYEEVAGSADVIAYNGHAGLGQNVRALARMGKWQKQKYQIFFMNGCDTFAYVDGSLAETRAAINSDDPNGTKYMEFVTNAMPSFFHSMAEASTTIITSLLDYRSPKTYEQMFKGIDRAEVVLVTGEEDNVFKPGMKIGR
ncbi:MAG: hypothetical protein KIT84_20860 [Labilithrix sp.]|nr:hypothetical protein [Labilithrix sp.]MCW5813493.1 hypothetical protein [Labilithrix sp.]